MNYFRICYPNSTIGKIYKCENIEQLITITQIYTGKNKKISILIYNKKLWAIRY